MKNKHDLPEPLVKALTVDRHKPVLGRFGVTTLIDSPLRRILNMQHFDELEDEVADNFWSFLGKMGHKVLEMDADTSEVKIEIPLFGATIVGVIDYSSDRRLTDWKFTSAWAAVFIKDKSDWEKQLQIYAYLLGLKGKPVEEISNYLILRDWNKREAQKSPDYPQIPFKKKSYNLWLKEAVEELIKERVAIHLSAEKYAYGSITREIPAEFWCTPEERWSKPDKWAVMKKVDGRAVRVLETKEAAQIISDSETERTGVKHFLIFRPGEDTRCENYCNLNQWCPFFAQKGGLV